MDEYQVAAFDLRGYGQSDIPQVCAQWQGPALCRIRPSTTLVGGLYPPAQTRFKDTANGRISLDQIS